jgi:hypothetical protein
VAVTYGAAGTFVGFSTTPTSVAYPTGIAAGNLLVLVGMPKVGSTALASQPALSGWTSQGYVRHGTTASANDAGSMAVMVWTKVADGTETGTVSVAWGLTPGAGQAIMYRLANATGGWDVAVQTVARSATTTAWSVTFGANPGITAGDFVAVHNSVPTDLSTASAAGTLTATGLTSGAATAIQAHQTDGTGTDTAVWADYYFPTGTASAAPTYASTLTGGTNLYGVAAIIRAREAIVAPTVGAGADASHTVNTAFSRTATEVNGGATITARTWVINSGPAGVGTTIGTAAALSWTPTVTGTYVLRYSATNSAGTGTDDVTVVVNPTVSTFVDNFATADTGKWTSFPAEAVVTGGQLQLTSGLGYPRIITLSRYSLIGSELVAELVGSAGAPSEDYILVRKDTTDALGFVVAGASGARVLQLANYGPGASLPTVTYDPVAHRWLRLTESGGTVTWWTSPDRSTWTSQRTLAAPFALTSLTVEIMAGYAGTAPTGPMIVDNINVTPAGGTIPARVSVSNPALARAFNW